MVTESVLTVLGIMALLFFLFLLLIRETCEIVDPDEGGPATVKVAARAEFVSDVRKYLPCLCHDSYKSRGMTDPACPWHVYAVELLTEEEFKG